MKSHDLVSQSQNLTYRKLDYWCQLGVFGERHVCKRPNRLRDFSDEDLRIAQVLARVSTAFYQWSGGRGGLVAIYGEIAEQMRAGVETVHVALDDGIEVVVQAPRATEPEPEPDPPAIEEPAEVGFVPGVGVDNA
jgi:hypothetical protein